MLWLLLFVHTVLCAHRELFKSCEQNGFCRRNIEYAHNKLQSQTSSYSVSSVDVSDSHLAGTITKQLGSSAIDFGFQILMNPEQVRFTLDEARPDLGLNSSRFSAGDFVIDAFNSTKSHVTQSSSQLTVANGDLRVVVDKKSFRIDVYRKNELEVSINKDLFLNIEHYRTKEDNQLLPEEVDFDLFDDSFKDSTADTKPFGPESIGLDFTFHGYKHGYGLPEHSHTLNLQDEIYRLYNVDIFEYEIESNLPMYGSIPFLLAVKPQSSVGLFWINSADTYIKITKTEDFKSHWMSENGKLDFILFFGDSPGDINRQYGLVTGYTSLPQLFSLGYHQCRWNYNDIKDVLQISNLFDEYHIPYDTIWLDIEYTDDKKYFTWHPDNFGDSQGMLRELDATGRNLVAIIDPHIKTGYEVSNYLVENSLTIKDSTNNTYYGHCWPGESVWVDSFNPRVQQYWDKLHEGFMGKATNLHLWNDMNEISVFNGPETTSPKDNLQYGDIEERSLHNLNGRRFHDLTYDSLRKRQSQRPFILTRSFFAGLQKSAAMWTGDNMSKWEYLRISIPMVLNNGIAGMPFAGADVGGFFGDPSKELLTRWYQTGIWYPFFRAHAHIDSRRREPWVPGEPYTSIIRDAVNLRYSLLPEFYNAFRESSVSGLPIMKPVFYGNTVEANLNIEDEFFLGNSGLLIKPVTYESAQRVNFILPDDEIYYNFFNGVPAEKVYTKLAQEYVSLNDIPILLRGGSIILRKLRYRRSSKLMKNDPYTLYVAPNLSGEAKGTLYVDDYESFDYQDGKFLQVDFVLKNSKLSSKVLHSFDVPNKIENIIILDAKKNIVINNVQLKINEEWTVDVPKEQVHDEL